MNLSVMRNPIFVKEIRTRMRGNRAFLLVTFHLLIQSLLVGLLLLIFRSAFSPSGSIEDQSLLSKMIFGLLVILELIMISFVSPALTAGSFSMERERRTFDLLRVTLLSARSLVLGKFTSALTFIFLLLATSIPMLSPAFMLGGVSGEEILVSIVVLLSGAITLCAIGLTISCLISRTLLANVLTYACSVFLIFGIPVMMLAAFVIVQSGNILRNEYMNAASLVIWMVLAWILISLSPLATLATTEYFLLNQKNLWVVEITLGNSSTFYMLSPWVSHLIIYSLITMVLIYITIRQVEKLEY